MKNNYFVLSTLWAYISTLRIHNFLGRHERILYSDPEKRNEKNYK